LIKGPVRRDAFWAASDFRFSENRQERQERQERQDFGMGEQTA
jgi:hypothetical protein